jgi:hypothetical protein
MDCNAALCLIQLVERMCSPGVLAMRIRKGPWPFAAIGLHGVVRRNLRLYTFPQYMVESSQTLLPRECTWFTRFSCSSRQYVV